jgi:uncharacterized protein YndB with AHSA1/START domain
MAPIVSSIEIARPPDQVFSYATDPSRFAEWQRDVVNVRMEGDGPPRVAHGSPQPAASVALSGPCPNR